jgi:soluble lytic murein transglycosylase
MTKKKINIKIIVSIAVIIVILVSAAFILKKANSVYTQASYPLKYQNEIDAASKKYGVDKSLIYGVIKTESNFDPDAKSSAGALGLMQLMPDTFEWLQTYYKDENDYKFEDLTDPAINIDYGVELLSILSKRYENEETMLCAYNGGLGNVDKWLDNKDYSDDGKTLKVVPFPETDKYRKLVEQNKSIYYQLYFKK